MDLEVEKAFEKLLFGVLYRSTIGPWGKRRDLTRGTGDV